MPLPARAGLADLVEVSAAPRVLRRLVALAFRYPVRFLLALATAIFANAATVALPRLLGQAVDHAHALLAAAGNAHEQAEAALWHTALLVLPVSAARGLLTMLSGFQFETIGQKIAYELRLALFDKLQRLDFSFHDRVHSGELITRGMLDLEGVRMFVEMGVQRIVTLLLLLGIGAAAMLSLDPLMGLLALSFVPFVLWQAGCTGLLLRLTWTMLQKRMDRLTRTIEENLQGARVVRAFASWAYELARFDRDARETLRMANQRIVVRTRSSARMTLAFYLAMALVLWVGGARIAAGQMSVGHLASFITFMLLLQAPVRQTMMMVNTFARAITSGSRLFEVLDREPAIADAAAGLPAPEDPTLTFEDVNFHYGPDQPPVLRGISFTVRPGQTLGVIGAPGSGKTTLAHLIPRFYDVSGGRITVGGRDIRDIPLASLRAEVALVAQDVFLFDATLSENIAYSEPGAPLSAVETSSRRAQLHDHIAGLPQVYDTRTGERGVALSGGQRQRLSIARGILGDPGILILDDSTSAIDAATEHRLRAQLLDYAKGRVTIVMSHRIASLRHADEIIALDEGCIVERGTHDQLVALGGRYARLFDMQTRDAPRPGASPEKVPA
jgi:ATP-binding cassette subfamily B multidrug efflux pump